MTRSTLATVANTLFDDVVFTDYGQFTIEWGDPADVWDGDPDRFFDGQVNGWVGAAQAGHLLVVIARRSGGSAVRIERCEAAPAVRDDEDVVEVSIRVEPGSVVMWRSWAAESEGALDLPPGDYRVRVSAAGRDRGHAEEFAEGVVDRYVLELWPAAVEPDAVVRVGSEEAAYWHAEWGNRR